MEELVESTCPYCFGPVGCCLVYLSGGQPKSICQLYTPSSNQYNLGFSLSFSLKPALKVTAGSPSTNVPIVCPQCHPDLAEKKYLPATYNQSRKKKPSLRPAVWKYSMKSHWSEAHPNSVMPNALCEDLLMSELERKILLATKGLAKYTGQMF